MLPSTGSTSLEWPLDKFVLVPGDGKLCPLDISAGRGTQPIRNNLAPKQPKLRLRRQKRTIFPSPKQVLGASCEKCASHCGNRPAYSLPLAWHEIKCCLPLRAPEGRIIPAPLCVLLPWPPPTPRWPVRTGVTDRKPQGQAIALDLPAAQKLTVLSC